MRIERSSTVVAAALAVSLTLAGCSSPAGSDDRSITVWSMNGDLSKATLDAINERFTARTGVTVDLQIQQWDNIITKITTALATADAPDVLDLGNTQVPIYAANGGLADLTGYRADLQQGRTWLAGLEEPATQDGRLYGVPSFAGNRTVIYNRTIWAGAGVTEPPSTFEELTEALDAVRAARPDPGFSPFYYPGRYAFGPLGFVWDAGGEIATVADGAWKAGFSSPEAQRGLVEFRDFQNRYSTPSSQSAHVDSPEQSQIFADGLASAILGVSSDIDKIKAANPKLKDADLGTFPFPGTSGRNQPVMLGGSVWGVSAASRKLDRAVEWIRIATSPEIQAEYVYANDLWIPNNTAAVTAALESGTMSPLIAGFFRAATNSKATPSAANWATIENDQSLPNFFSTVASGAKSPEQAAREFDDHIESVLND
ncbi:extracellular solute-binding protein [Plantactinospora sp. WMMB782]|uniref:extracellular solute-binding protein n=1 Tax=Plantactinospora sp. WMMB782 TaxID=3404121 RepID=UPI003B94CDB3